MKAIQGRRIVWLGLPVAALSLLGAGCIPGVAWLPDSSGFVYSGGDKFQQIVRYDLDRKQTQVLVADTGASTLWPAVRPDGKQFAVARLERQPADETGKLEVIFYGLDGKNQRQSQRFDWPRGHVEPGNAFDRDAEPLKATQLYWAPQGGKLLVLGDNTTGIYDLKTDEMKVLPGRVLSVFGNTPITPDGKAFVVTRLRATEKETIEGLDLVDWDGKETPLPLPKEVLEVADHQILLRWPFLAASRWDGPVAVVHLVPVEIRVDTARRRVAIERSGPEPKAEEPRTINTFTFPEGAQVRITQSNRSKAHRLEVRKPGAQEPSLVRDADWWLLNPAPNGKLVTARDVKGSILVIDHKGELVAEIETRN
jgi:hypothetical protein